MNTCTKTNQKCSYANKKGNCGLCLGMDCKPKENTTYCYARVSTKEQKLDRQIAAFEPYQPYELFTDKESGKDFDRPQYQKLRKTIKTGDTLIVLSLDRFGRNYDQIKQEFAYFNQKGVKIKVIDMPIIDTTTNDLTTKLISDIVIQLLGYVAEKERDYIRKRQAEGIKIAKANGVHMGKPRYKLPDNFKEVAKKYQNYEVTQIEARELLGGMTKSTFLKYIKIYGYSRKISNLN